MARISEAHVARIFRRAAIPLILLLGTAVRTIHLFYIGLDSPFMKGGLFAEFARQIWENGLRMPSTIPYYSEGGIPFLYPPLPFYVEALFIHRLGLPEFAVANLLPAVVSVISLVGFAGLARQASSSWTAAVVSVLSFSLYRGAWGEQIEGGGLAEAFGTLSLVMLFLSLEYLARQPQKLQGYVVTGASWGLCILSSPGSAYASLLFLAIGMVRLVARSRPNLNVRGFLVLAVTGLLLSAPYWVGVLQNVGPGYMIEAFRAQHASEGTVSALTAYWRRASPPIRGASPLADTPVLGALIVAGVVSQSLKRRGYWPAAFLLAMLIPREEWVTSVPACLLIGSGLGDLFMLLPTIACPLATRRAVSGAIALVAVPLVLYALVSPARQAIRRAIASDKDSVDQTVLNVAHWIQQNTPEDSRLLVVAQMQVAEWFPHLARRTTANVAQGTEFDLPDRRKVQRLITEMAFCGSTTCMFDKAASLYGPGQYYILWNRPFRKMKNDLPIVWEDNRYSLVFCDRVPEGGQPDQREAELADSPILRSICVGIGE